MNRILLILIILFLIFNTNCESQNKNSGLEVYVLNITNPLLTGENPKNCYCCIELSKDKLNSESLITDSDIEYFNWEKQKIKLKESGIKKLTKLDFSKKGVDGILTAIVLNGKPIYALMIFPFGSSSVCDRVFTHLPNLSSELYMHFGAGTGQNEMRYGSDPRYNSELETYVKKRFKKD